MYHRDVGASQSIPCLRSRFGVKAAEWGKHIPCIAQSICICLEGSCLYRLQPVSVSVTPMGIRSEIFPAALLHLPLRTKLSFIIQPSAFVVHLCVALGCGAVGWCCNSRHCGLEAGTLLPIRIKQWTLALHFSALSLSGTVNLGSEHCNY